MKKLLTYLLEEILNSKDFEIVEEKDDNFTRLKVILPQELMGMAIGKEGRTIKSIRNILKIKAAIEKTGVYVFIEEKTPQT